MEHQDSYIPITEKELEERKSKINDRLRAVDWTPDAKFSARQTVEEVWRATNLETQIKRRKSFTEQVERLSEGDILLSEPLNYVFRSVRRGFMIGSHVSRLYSKASQLTDIIQRKTAGNSYDEAEFHAKQTTSSAIMLFVAAYYIVWRLKDYKTEQLSSIKMDLGSFPPVSLFQPIDAQQSSLYYYVAYLEDSGMVQTDLTFAKMTLVYFESLLEEMKMKVGSLEYAEPFTNNNYKLETEEFSVDGFETKFTASVKTAVFGRVEEHEIVGNARAKLEAVRAVKMLLCYCFLTKRNPLAELGGFSWLRLGYGLPGVGKGMLIKYIATLLSDACNELNIPLLLWELPNDLISTFQGGSDKHMDNYCDVLFHDDKLIYAVADDAERKFEDRTRQAVSEGVKGVIEVFLRRTEGASAIIRGNTLWDFFTNLPEIMDPAVLSRMQHRFEIKGAETEHDFVDQEYLGYRHYDEIDPNFRSMEKPKNYEYLSAQKVATSIREAIDFQGSTVEMIQEIDHEVKKQFDPMKEEAYYGYFYNLVKDVFPSFSSRDVRNIQKAVHARVMDFEIPDEWIYTSPEKFYVGKTYEEKKDILIDLMKENMDGVSFPRLRYEETITYVDQAVQIEDRARQREIREMVDNEKKKLKALKILEEELKAERSN